MCVSGTSHGNIFWFQSHQEKDAACVQHLHCSYVRHVLPGCPFWIPNFLRWGLVLLPVQSIVLAPSSVATAHVQLFILCMHYLCMRVSLCSSVICSYALKISLMRFCHLVVNLSIARTVTVDFFSKIVIWILKTHGLWLFIKWLSFTLIKGFCWLNCPFWSSGKVEAELLHTYSRIDPYDTLILCVRVAVLTAVTLTVPIVLFPVSANLALVIFFFNITSPWQRIKVFLFRWGERSSRWFSPTRPSTGPGTSPSPSFSSLSSTCWSFLHQISWESLGSLVGSCYYYTQY